MRERDRETEDSDCYIDPYLLNRVDSIFRALHLWWAVLHQREGIALTPTLTPGWHPRQLDCPSNCDSWLTMTDHSVCWYLCIYNFITPMRSFQLSTHVISFQYPLVCTGASCLWNPSLMVLSKVTIRVSKLYSIWWYYDLKVLYKEVLKNSWLNQEESWEKICQESDWICWIMCPFLWLCHSSFELLNIL